MIKKNKYFDTFGHIKVVKFLLNADLEFFSKKEYAKNIVIKYNLSEFYEKI